MDREHTPADADGVAREREFMEVFHRSADAMLLIDGETLVDCNERAVVIFGASSKEEVLATGLSDLSPAIQPDGRRSPEKAGEMIAHAFDNGIHRFEWHHCRLDGEAFPVEVTLVPVLLRGNRLLHCLCRDLSAQKHAESKLRILSLAVEESPASIVITDSRGTIEYVNPMFTRVTGYTAPEVIGQNPRILKSGEWPKEAYETLWNTILAGRTWTGEFINKKKNGERFWEAASISPMRDAQGAITHYVAIKQDITERKQFERALHAANWQAEQERNKLRAMIEGMAEGVVVADENDVISDVNAWFVEKTGMDRTALIGRSMWELHPDTAGTQRLQAVLAEFRDGRRRDTYVVNRDLLGMQLMLRAQPIFHEGVYRGVVLNAVDVTNLVEARRTAEAANAAKSRFLANMSHEIRTPMTAIQGFAEVMRDELTCPTACSLPADCAMRQLNMERINTICSNAEHLLEVIDDILDLSKIEAGSMSVEKVRVVPREVLTAVASLMEPRAMSRGLEFSIAWSGRVPAVIESDPTRLRQAVFNLVGNAIKFTEKGGITVRVGFDESEGTPQLVVEVADTGIGIPPHRLRSIFEPFEQADSSTTRRFGGTGLGLAVTQRIAELLGGRLEVMSEVGKGSVFTLRVAAGALEGAESLDPPVEEVASPEHRKEPEAGPLNARVLLVEDGADNRRLISYILAKTGAVVESAEDGRAGVERALAAEAAENSYDVVLMDMQMPVMDGYEATQFLRRSGYRRPIIALTAHAMSEDRIKCLEAGCDDFASKPIQRAALISLVRRYCPRGVPAPAAGGS